MALLLVVDAPAGSGEIGVPEPLAVPVGLGEVAAYHEALLAEDVEHVVGDILPGIVLERSVCDGEVRVFGVEGAEAVMVLGGENHVFDTSILHDLRPLFGIEADGVQFVFQPEVPLLVLIVGQSVLARNPVHVFRADGPRLHDSRYGVKPPVEEDAELLVLPFVQFVQHLPVFGPDVAALVRLLVYKALHLLGVGVPAKRGAEKAPS